MLDDMTCRSQRMRRRRARETEVLYNIRRWESEIAKGRLERERERDTRIIDYQSKTMLFRTSEGTNNSTQARQEELRIKGGMRENVR